MNRRFERLYLIAVVAADLDFDKDLNFKPNSFSIETRGIMRNPPIGLQRLDPPVAGGKGKAYLIR